MKKPPEPKSKIIRIIKNREKSILKRKKSHKSRLLRWKNSHFIPIVNNRNKQVNVMIDKTIISPQKFSLIENAEEMLAFTSQLKHAMNFRTRIYLNTEDVSLLTNDAIVALISILNDFKKRDIRFSGKVPKDTLIRDKFEQSGFFEYVYGHIKSKNKNSKTKIFTKSHKQVLSELTSEIVSEATNTVFGHREGSEYIQRVLVEVMTNTHNHSSINEGSLEWWLSVEHDEYNKKVSFAFIDNGMGIMESINKRAYNSGILDQIIGLFSDARVFEDIFNGKLKSRTNLQYRGKGLPTIYKGFKQNFYSNLCVLTNNVKAHFESDSFSYLKNKFAGTLIYFELNERNLL